MFSPSKLDTRGAGGRSLTTDGANVDAPDSKTTTPETLEPPHSIAPQVWGTLVANSTTPTSTTTSPVSGTAQAKKGWGPQTSDAMVNFDHDSFASMPANQQQELIKGLTSKRDDLQRRIDRRVKDLDGMWAKSPRAARMRALRAYYRQSKRIDAEGRRQLDKYVSQSEQLQSRIDKLQTEADACDQSSDLCRAKRSELSQAETEQNAAIVNAQVVVDDRGLHVDFMVVNEQLIDPNAPAKGSGSSLLDLVEELFRATQALNAIEGFIEKMRERHDEQETAAREQRYEEQRRAEQVQRDLNNKADNKRNEEHAATQRRDRLKNG